MQYAVGTGNNDYINNYLLPQFYSTNSSYMPDQYATVVIQEYSQQLKVFISNSHLQKMINFDIFLQLFDMTLTHAQPF